ncbi:hypothetical protein IW262DRAFT_273836 [Armillaria fumosa]|nr:hypothetical protein IW262DRAFT_273836 [Armillaria fumosa]
MRDLPDSQLRWHSVRGARITLLIPLYTSFFVITWIITIVAVCFMPIEVLPHIFSTATHSRSKLFRAQFILFCLAQRSNLNSTMEFSLHDWTVYKGRAPLQIRRISVARAPRMSFLLESIVRFTGAICHRMKRSINRPTAVRKAYSTLPSQVAQKQERSAQYILFCTPRMSTPAPTRIATYKLLLISTCTNIHSRQ